MGEVMQLDTLGIVGHDELPIAVAHRQTRPVIGFGLRAKPLPENRASAWDSLAIECGEQVLAIAFVVRRQGDARSGAERGQQIDGGEGRGVVLRTGSRVPRPTDDEGHAHAAFKQAALAPTHAASLADAVVGIVALDLRIGVRLELCVFRGGVFRSVVA